MKTKNILSGLAGYAFLFIGMLLTVSSCDDTLGNGFNPNDKSTVDAVKLTRVWNIDSSKVSVSGYIANPGTWVDMVFEYGTDPNLLTKKIIATAVYNAARDTAFLTGTIGKLTPNTDYYVRVNAIKTTGGESVSQKKYDNVSETYAFTTTASPVPVINSVKYANVESHSLDIIANINPNGHATSYQLFLGDAPENLVAVSASKGGQSEVFSTEGDITISISDLESSHSYYFKIVASNDVGECESSINYARTFEGTVTDANGKVYHVAKIGDQVWTAQNWACDKYNDGTIIDSCFVYNNDESNLSARGRLYTYEALKANQIAPEGWRVPTKKDWEQLIETLGGKFVAGDQLKMKSFVNPASQISVYNPYNFNASVCGMRNVEGSYLQGTSQSVNSYVYYWGDSTTHDGTQAYRVYINYRYDDCLPGYAMVKNAYSVRLIKE